jgi:hypothetical protein
MTHYTRKDWNGLEMYLRLVDEAGDKFMSSNGLTYTTPFLDPEKLLLGNPDDARYRENK